MVVDAMAARGAQQCGRASVHCQSSGRGEQYAAGELRRVLQFPRELDEFVA